MAWCDSFFSRPTIPHSVQQTCTLASDRVMQHVLGVDLRITDKFSITKAHSIPWAALNTLDGHRARLEVFLPGRLNVYSVEIPEPELSYRTFDIATTIGSAYQELEKMKWMKWLRMPASKPTGADRPSPLPLDCANRAALYWWLHCRDG
jgi:hypothetical protein